MRGHLQDGLAGEDNITGNVLISAMRDIQWFSSYHTDLI